MSCFLYVICNYLHNGVEHDFHIRWYSCHFIVTHRITLVEQEMLTFQSTWVLPCINSFGCSRCSIIIFLCFCRSLCFLFVFSFCHSVVCPFVLFLFGIVLSVLLWFTSSDYPLVFSNLSSINKSWYMSNYMLPLSSLMKFTSY